MLSYLHGFHAGNFADLLKHLVLSESLIYLTQKPKPLFYLDTHSGAGAYRLDSHQASKTQEFMTGIGKLWQDQANRMHWPAAIDRYFTLIQQFNQTMQSDKTLDFYPGSPWIAQQTLRPIDRLSLFELHPQEQATLASHTSRDKRCHLFASNGFQACKSQLPPKEKRGFILIDPPYEVKQDYQTVIQAIQAGHKKFATGTYALWYPVVERQRITQLENQLMASGIKNVQLFELGMGSDTQGQGMTASGMIVINPPWTLYQTLKECLPFLANLIAGQAGTYRIEQLVEE